MQKHNINNTKRHNTSMVLNKAFLLIQCLYMEFLHKFSLLYLFFLLLLILNTNNTMIQARVSILRFPSQKVNCPIYS